MGWIEIFDQIREDFRDPIEGDWRQFRSIKVSTLVSNIGGERYFLREKKSLGGGPN